MKIGIIGSGDVARSLATGLVRHGHSVTLGTRNTASLTSLLADKDSISVGSVSAAAAFGEITVLAVKGNVTLDVVRGVANEFVGKTVIDTTHPITDAPPEQGVLSYFTDVNDSLLEMLQRVFSAVNFVKAFNSVGAASMIDSNLPCGPSTMFIAGTSADAKRAVAKLLEQVGWEVAEMGGDVEARALEPLCRL